MKITMNRDYAMSDDKGEKVATITVRDDGTWSVSTAYGTAPKVERLGDLASLAEYALQAEQARLVRAPS